jgi:hypothetical protein
MSKGRVKDPMKIVVFDLDETLGSFIEIGMFWDALEHFYGHNLMTPDFFDVLRIFPEFLRPNILDVLKYLMQKKQEKKCDKIMIYTNNQGPKTWTIMISEFLNQAVGEIVFDNVIGAFKVRGKVIEMGRTTHDKCVSDLIRCTQIPANAEICFLDDMYHPLMEHDNVFYINVKPYHYSMAYAEMAKRYYEAYSAKLPNNVPQDVFIAHIVNYMQRYNYVVTLKNESETAVDVIVSKKIMLYLEDFFRVTARIAQTRRKRLLKYAVRTRRYRRKLSNLPPMIKSS